MDSSFQLTEKVAVITGGASGIGYGIAHRFGRAGARIEILDFDDAQLSQALGTLREDGLDAQGAHCDVRELASVDKAFEGVLERRGRCDILVNNAGIAHVGNALTTSAEDFSRVLSVNVHGVAHCTQAALRSMTEAKRGVILNIASSVSVMAIPDRFAYSTSKGAVLAMTYSVAKDFLEDGIRCNAILPGRIHTPFVEGFIKKNYPGQEAAMFEKLSLTQPIGRMGKPDEIASAAQYLCSDEASFVTGGAFPVDGGTLTLR